MPLFISDLHLSPKDPQTTLEFLKFLDSPLAKAHSELFILGDLFARWIGDDAMTLFEYDLAYRLSEFQSENKTIYFMPGNRDFLISEKFLKISQLKLLPDPYILNIHNQNILLTHGDQLCTDDRAYQIYRKIAQAPITRWLFLKLPLWIRQKIARFLQRKHDFVNPSPKNIPKSPNLKYHASEIGIQHLLQQTKFSGTLMIHGHTHEPMETQHFQVTRIVLGDWQNYPGYSFRI